MKKYNNWISKLIAGVFLLPLVISSCVDEIKFGNAFLEKAPGGTVTFDTVFNSPEYARQFLVSLYAKLYYGIGYENLSDFEASNPYVGKWEILTDLYTYTYNSNFRKVYYGGTHTANYKEREDKFAYLRNRIWEAIRGGWIVIENVDKVPGLDEQEKKSMKAQAKCIIASRYLDAFRHFGGVPLVKHAFSANDDSYKSLGRASVQEMTDYIVQLLDEAAQDLPWEVENPAVERGRWTKSAAMGYKCRVLQFAASPLFNDEEPFYPGVTDNPAIWLGGYKPEMWDRCLKACEEFFAELNANGVFHLQQPKGTRMGDYRMAYRAGYFNLDSPEVLFSTRVTTKDNATSDKYCWALWQNIHLKNCVRRANCPTQEYVEMFPWKDGTPFDWNKTEQENRLNEMFIKSLAGGKQEFTRDPRLYEEVIVNGMPISLDWTTANMQGRCTEGWVGGKDARKDANTQVGSFATGYTLHKFLIGPDYIGRYIHWPALRLSELYLIYAEALCQSANGNMAKAIDQINIVRSRVGMGGLVECNPDKNLLSDKKALMDEILRERACELGMEDARYFDLVRYKRADIFEKRLHGLKIFRLDDSGNRTETPWYGKDDKNKPFPTEFEYEKYELTNPVRYWWREGYDPKWYLSPFPASEVNKGNGLIQNPGW